MGQIYGLFSPRTGKVRYVGQSLGSHQERFKQHKREAAANPTSELYRWFHHEWRLGFPVRSALLCWCENERLGETEADWIRKFPLLLNQRKLPRSDLRADAPGSISEIVNYRRTHLFNVDGFRGVHFSHHAGRYFVLIYTGRGVDWLVGDEMPAEKDRGNIWFSDLATAVDARDRRREELWALDFSGWAPDESHSVEGA